MLNKIIKDKCHKFSVIWSMHHISNCLNKLSLKSHSPLPDMNSHKLHRWQCSHPLPSIKWRGAMQQQQYVWPVQWWPVTLCVYSVGPCLRYMFSHICCIELLWPLWCDFMSSLRWILIVSEQLCSLFLSCSSNIHSAVLELILYFSFFIMVFVG